MKFIKSTLLPVLLAGIWISLNEFIRNQFLLFDYWTTHYEKLGMTFPAEAVNGAIWGIWAMVFAAIIFIVRKKFNFLQTVSLMWLSGFVLMWLVTGNMAVLPLEILIFAIPWSIFEVAGAVYLTKIARKS